MDQPITEKYLASLPERLIRSAAALAGGTSLLLTNSLLPEPVRKSTTYKVTIGDMQRFIINRLAQVGLEDPEGMEPISDDYIYHKMAGNVLELASFMAVRFSPVWIFAIVSDAAGGSSHYFDRLVTQLKEMGVVGREAQFDNIPDLLESIQKASSTAAKAIDRPPLSQSELDGLLAELRADYRGVANSSGKLMPRVEKIQGQMEEISEEEGVSIERLSETLTLKATDIGRTGAQTAVAVGKTTGQLFQEQILDSYSATLEEISRVGLARYTYSSIEPFLTNAINHLDPGKETWTEKKLAEFLESPNTAG